MHKQHENIFDFSNEEKANLLHSVILVDTCQTDKS